MPRFQRKPKVRLNKFCRDFYNENILHPIVRGTNVSAVYFDRVRASVVEADPSFANVGPESFESEIKILRFEVFGLAWLHELGNKLIAAQSEFTKRYLEEEGRLDIWEAIEPYNQAIALSSTLGQQGDTPSGRAYLTRTNYERLQMCNHWYEQGFEPKCAARAANRFFTEEAWEGGLTPGFLMLTLCDKLGCEVNEEAQFRLMAVIMGLYDGSRAAFREVEIEP